MTGYRALLAAALVLLLPAPVLAQAASPADAQLQMERRQRRVIVRPSPPPEAIAHDVQTATEEIERRENALRRTAPRRPDLDYDVKSGIQSQRLNDALRRR